MADFFSIGVRSLRVAVSNAVPTNWANNVGSGRVRVSADVATHVRIITSAVDATQDNFILWPRDSVVVPLSADQYLSFLAYTEALGTKEAGSLNFLAVANASDTVTVNDGTSSAVVFTFGDGTGGTVNRGASALASAEALRAAIQAKIDAVLLLVSVMRFGTQLLIVNNNYTGGTLSEGGSGVSGRIALTNFAGGAAPGSPPAHSGSVWVTEVK